MKPLCFVLMPFDKKPYGDLIINFDEIYATMIKPAIFKAGMDPVRADEEKTDGIIHKAMFERLILCDYAVADLTTANANVFYELGVRHAVKPYTTVLMYATSTRLPFDISFLRSLPYTLDKEGNPLNTKNGIKLLSQKLIHATKEQASDSPLFQLLDNYPDLSHEKTDIFRESIQYSIKMKETLTNIRYENKTREQKIKDLKEFEKKLGDITRIESGIIIDLFLSYRFVEAYEEMIFLVHNMSKPLASTVMVREQFAFALNRLKKAKEAEDVLIQLIAERGPSAESYGILGRVYKDQWEEAKQAKNKILINAFLRKSIDTYKKGFDADMRDAYPGINALTLMYIEDPLQQDFKNLLPVVKYGVEKKISVHGGDYWDFASLFELAILNGQELLAQKNLELAAGLLKEPWNAKTTLNNLKHIRQASQDRGEDVQWLLNFENQLEKLIQTE